MEKEVCSNGKDFKRKRKHQETEEQTREKDSPSSSQEKFLRLSSNRPVRRKLCFDSFEDKNSTKEQSTSKDGREK